MNKQKILYTQITHTVGKVFEFNKWDYIIILAAFSKPSHIFVVLYSCCKVPTT